MINLVDPVSEIYDGYQSGTTKEEDPLNPNGDTTLEDQEMWQIDNATGKTQVTSNLTLDDLFTIPDEYNIWKDTGSDRPKTPIFYQPFDDQKQRRTIMYGLGMIIIIMLLVKYIL